MSDLKTNTTPTIKGIAILIPAYLIGILFDYLFGIHYLGLSFPIFTILIFNVFIIYAGITKKLKLNLNWLFVIPIFLLSFTFTLTDNLVLRTINFFLVPILLLGTFILLTAPPGVKWFKFGFIEVIGTKMTQWFDSLILPYSTSIEMAHGKKFNWFLAKKILIGLAIGGVLSIVLITLLSSADKIFDKYLIDVFDFIPDADLNSIIIHTLKIIVSASLIGSLFYAILNNKTKQDPNNTLKIPTFLDPITINIALSFAIIIYILFGIVQFVYLFGGDANIKEFGMTYSDYAVDGFWELNFVAFINLLIILGGLYLTKFQTLKSKISTKLLLGAINILTFILIYSSHLRLSLYEATYGFTHQRIFAHVVILFLFILFLYIGFKIVRTQSSFTRAAVVIWLSIYTVLNFINVDGYIMQKNIERFEESGKIDVYYLYELSSDAVPGILSIRDDIDLVEDKVKLENILKFKYEQLNEQMFNQPWYSFNLSRSHALDLLTPIYEKNPTNPIIHFNNR